MHAVSMLLRPTAPRGVVPSSGQVSISLGYPSRSASLSDTKQLRSRSNTMLKRHVEEGTGPKFGRKDRFSSFQRKTVLARLKAGIMRVRGTSVCQPFRGCMKRRAVPSETRFDRLKFKFCCMGRTVPISPEQMRSPWVYVSNALYHNGRIIDTFSEVEVARS